MKRLLFGTMLFALAIVVPIPTMAAVDINVTISLPPPIVFNAPPDVIVLPDTGDVYVDPDVNVDLFFWNGWWWRLWDGRWYRSRYYNRGWGYYNRVPSFYFDVDPGWRGYYRDRNWQGHRWEYERIPDQRLQQNWKSWHTNQYWEKQQTWGVQGYQPRPQQQRQDLRQQRQQQYQQRPEVRQQRSPQAQQPQAQPQQRQPQAQQPQRQEQRPQAQQPQAQPQQRQPQTQRPQQPQRQPQAQPQQRQPQQSVQRPQGEERRLQAEQPQRSQGRPEGKEGEHEK